eukprot:m.11368 g.11368  ORF g.11368 m.11368 type:complete len:158 (-) comp4431_c0_seq1:181-654(-)
MEFDTRMGAATFFLDRSRLYKAQGFIDLCIYDLERCQSIVHNEELDENDTLFLDVDFAEIDMVLAEVKDLYLQDEKKGKAAKAPFMRIVNSSNGKIQFYNSETKAMHKTQEDAESREPTQFELDCVQDKSKRDLERRKYIGNTFLIKGKYLEVWKYF